MAYRGFKPLFDRVLVQRVVAETKSKGGILLPGAAKELPIAKVLSVGEGLRLEDGSVRSLNVVIGDRVLLPEFGGQKIKLGEEEFDLYRDAEFLGKFNES
jgi:chaperonin GroES